MAIDQKNYDPALAANASEIVRVRHITEAERDALTPVDGMLIYNTTNPDLNVYVNGSWEVVALD